MKKLIGNRDLEFNDSMDINTEELSSEYRWIKSQWTPIYYFKQYFMKSRFKLVQNALCLNSDGERNTIVLFWTQGAKNKTFLLRTIVTIHKTVGGITSIETVMHSGQRCKFI